MTLRVKQEVFSMYLAIFILRGISAGYRCSIGEVFRTEYQQKYYVSIGLSKTMNSMHLSKLAADLFWERIDKKPMTTEDWMYLGGIWITLHPSLRWGGDWNKNNQVTDEKLKDFCHFEYKL